MNRTIETHVFTIVGYDIFYTWGFEFLDSLRCSPLIEFGIKNHIEDQLRRS